MQNTPRILIVEDDPSLQDLYQSDFQELGYDVTIVGDRVSAEDAIAQRLYHVAIVDIRLSERDPNNIDGLRVLEKLWGLDEGTEAIVVTGHTTDMFAQFRKFHMFGTDDKPLMTPGDLLEQSRSAAFVKNYFSKEEGFKSIIDKVNQLIPSVVMNFNKRKWTDSPFSLVRGFSAAQVQQELKSGIVSELRPFLSELCRPFHPWLRSTTMANRITLDDKRTNETKIVGFEFNVWSRSMGQSLLFRFGRADSQDHFVSYQPRDTRFDPRPILTANHFNFAGAVFALPNVPLNDNFQPPASKRVSQAVF